MCWPSVWKKFGIIKQNWNHKLEWTLCISHLPVSAFLLQTSPSASPTTWQMPELISPHSKHKPRLNQNTLLLNFYGKYNCCNSGTNINKVYRRLISESKWIIERVQCELRNQSKDAISKNNIANFSNMKTTCHICLQD